jgi:gamma-butyrobetaine dioxygenase
MKRRWLEDDDDVKPSTATPAGLQQSAEPSPSPCAITTIASVDLRGADVHLSLTTEGSHSAADVTLPGVFLRDACQCSACFHPTTLQRIVDDVDPDIAPTSAAVSLCKTTLQLEWPDGHRTTFSTTQLSQWRLLATPAVQPLSSWSGDWMKAHIGKVTFAFDAVAERGAATSSWLATLRRYGLTKLTGAQQKFSEVERLAAALRVPLRPTVYDEEAHTFRVVVKPSANNQAYTSAALGLHTDLPFYKSPPTVQLLHCVQQSDPSCGGESVFADGMNAVERLAEESPDDVELLSTQPVVFEDVDPSEQPRYHLEAVRPVLESLPGSAERFAINLNNGVRASRPCAGAVPSRRHYHAVAKLRSILSAEVFEQLASPGDIWVFDNRRVLHGRRALVGQGGLRRALEGCYMEWDDLEGLARVLAGAPNSSNLPER